MLWTNPLINEASVRTWNWAWAICSYSDCGDRILLLLQGNEKGKKGSRKEKEDLKVYEFIRV